MYVAMGLENFRVDRQKGVVELNATLTELTHHKTQAKVLHIGNDDPENFFCLSFHTIPKSSNGVMHVLEHILFTGSKRFPIQDPFFTLMKRSMNTYMNAYTLQDFTIFPAATQIETDFYHLLDVYIDSVFFPLLLPVRFLQEAWRLDLSEPDNIESPLQYTGVVYNEMKGAMNSLLDRFNDAIYRNLMPQTPYAYNYGGSPQEIVTLRYEEMVAYHKEFYHPSHCLFFFYGNIPINKHLDFIEQKILSKAPQASPLEKDKKQPRFKSKVQTTEYYPVAQLSKAQATITFAWLTVDVIEQDELLALAVLNNMMTGTDASPLTKVLLQSQLCTGVSAGLSVHMSEVPWIITCLGCEEKDADRLETLFFSTLKKCQSSVFTKEQIEASLHQIEFERKEIKSQTEPFGANLFFRTGILKQFGGDAESGLLIESHFKILRNKIKNPTFFSDLIQKYIFDNPHYLRLIMAPDEKLVQKEELQEKNKLEEIRRSLSIKEKEKIRQNGKDIEAYFKAPLDKECIPKIELKDLSKNPKDFTLKELQEGDLTIYHHGNFTNGILYANLLFELPEIDADDLPILSFFMNIWSSIGCGNKNYAQTLEYQELYIGSIDAGLSIYTLGPGKCAPKIFLKGKALYRNSGKLIDLFADMLTKVDLDDEQRIKELLGNEATELEANFANQYLPYATLTAMKGFSIDSFMADQCQGFPYFEFIQKAARNWNAQFKGKLKEIAALCMYKTKADLVLSCDNGHYKELIGKKWIHKLSLKKEPVRHPWKGNYLLATTESQVRFVATQLAFNVYGIKTISYSQDPSSAITPLILLCTELLQNVILHKKLREKGGAYGSGATFTIDSGQFVLFSFRDPSLAQSMDILLNSFKLIAEGQFEERELEEAKLGIMRILDSPVSPENKAMSAYAWKMTGRNFEKRKAFRDKVFSATKQEVALVCRKHLVGERGVFVSFLSKDLWEKDKNRIAFPLQTLSVPYLVKDE